VGEKRQPPQMSDREQMAGELAGSTVMEDQILSNHPVLDDDLGYTAGEVAWVFYKAAWVVSNPVEMDVHL
jgi:hypothetical protein